MQTPTTTPQTTTLIESDYKPIRADLLAQIRAYKSTNKLSDEKFARLIGASGSQVNRALNNKFEGTPEVFESKVEDFFKAEPSRRAAREELFENEFSRSIKTFLDTVRRTEDIGIAYCAAGKGKTSGIALYLAENPLAVGIELSKWNGGADGLARLMFASIDARSWKGNTSRGDFLAGRFAESRRLIIIDNAHRMTAGARQWIFDFHDATGCPVALVGNPEILDAIRLNDQQFSRVGLRSEIKGGGAKQAESDGDKLTEIHWPEARGKLAGLAATVIKNRGHLRALKKQLLLARDLAAGFDTPAEAFEAAHTKLVRDYSLTK